MNIVDLVLFQCHRQPPAPAICAPGPGIGLISYWRLEKFIHNVSRKLFTLGLPPKSVIGIYIDDVIFHAVVALAAARLGIATVSLRAAGGRLPVQLAAVITDAQPQVSPAGHVVVADLSWIEGDGRPLEAHNRPQVSDDDICRLILTSGTTSLPRAVAVSHGLLADRINRHMTVFGNRLPNCERIYTDVPITSSLGFQFLIYILWRGGTAFFPGDTFQDTLRVLDDYRVQCLVGSPGAFETLLKWFDSIPAYQSNIELMICGGDYLSRSLSERIRGRICSHLIAAYGSTEASMTATAYAHEINEVPRAVGFVTPGVSLQIVDEAGTILPPEQEGRIRIRTRYAVNEYFGVVDGTVETFRDGWFYPGDIGTLSSSNLLRVTGREQSILNIGGDKIMPETVEQALVQFEGITEAAAVATSNALGTSELCALIVSNRKIEEQGLRAHCEERLPRHSIPTQFFFISDLPHNEMGKIDRAALGGLVKQLAQTKAPN